MTETEIKLLNLIREQDNVEVAIDIAVNTILEFLKQDGSFQEQPPACPKEPA